MQLRQDRYRSPKRRSCDEGIGGRGTTPPAVPGRGPDGRYRFCYARTVGSTGLQRVCRCGKTTRWAMGPRRCRLDGRRRLRHVCLFHDDSTVDRWIVEGDGTRTTSGTFGEPRPAKATQGSKEDETPGTGSPPQTACPTSTYFAENGHRHLSSFTHHVGSSGRYKRTFVYELCVQKGSIGSASSGP